MRARAAVAYTKSAPLQICEVELADPKESEVLVKMAGCGVCHADLAGLEQLLPMPLPAVFGHEGSGIVEQVGSHVKTIKPGDRVVLCAFSCGKCEACMTGCPSCCEIMDDVNFGGIYADGTKRLRDKDGVELSAFFSQSSFSTYAIADERNTVSVDSDVDIALLGPLGCGLQTGAGAVLNRLRPYPGDSIAIFGCGSVGLSAVMAAKISNCSVIIGIDIIPSRLSMALELGATHVINGKETENIAEKVRSITGKGVDYSLETTASLITDALYCLKRGGSAVTVSATGNSAVGIRLQDALMDTSRSLIGLQQGYSIPKLFIPKLVDFHTRGLFPFDKFIKYYSLDDINNAFEDSHNGRTVKPIIKF